MQSDLFGRVEFGRVRWPQNECDILGGIQDADAVPPGLIENYEGVGVRARLAAKPSRKIDMASVGMRSITRVKPSPVAGRTAEKRSAKAN